MKLFFTIILLTVFGLSHSQSNKILHLDLNAGIRTYVYANPIVEAGFSVDFPYFTAMLSHSKTLWTLGKDEHYWQRFGLGNGEVRTTARTRGEMQYSKLAVLGNIDFFGLDLFIGPGLFYRYEYEPDEIYGISGFGRALVGGFRINNFNIKGTILLPFYSSSNSGNIKLGYRFGFINSKKENRPRLDLRWPNTIDELEPNRVRLEAGAGIMSSMSAKYSSFTVRPFWSLQYYFKKKDKLYFKFSERGAAYGSDDFPYVELSNEEGEIVFVENLAVLSFQQNYALGYNRIIKRNSQKDIDYEAGGGFYATRDVNRGFVKNNWNVETDGLGTFANAQVRYKMFAVGIDVNIPVAYRLPVNFAVYTSVGINYKGVGWIKRLIGKKKED